MSKNPLEYCVLIHIYSPNLLTFLFIQDTVMELRDDVLYFWKFWKGVRVPVSHIVYLQAAVNYTILNLFDNKTLVMSMTLKRFEELLKDKFVRIHKSTIINTDHINVEECTKRSKKWVIVVNKWGTTIEFPTSRRMTVATFRKIKKLENK